MAARLAPHRPLKTLRRLTDEQRALVAQWMPMAAGKAIRSAIMQDADRDDAIQEAFLQLCKTAHTFDASRGLQYSTLASTSVRFHLLSEFHRRQANGFAGLSGNRGEPPQTTPYDSLPHDAVPAAPTTEEPDRVHNERLCRALSYLDERSYYIVLMRVIGGLTLSQIGKVFGITKERVRQIQGQAIKRLRKLLAPSNGSTLPA